MTVGRRMSRRALLKGMAAAAAVSIVPARVLGGAGRVPPSERVTMGFIGIGGQGGGHLSGGAWTYVDGGYLGREDVQILGVCDVRREIRQRALERVNAHYAQRTGAGGYRACEAYNDFRELLARSDIDAVLIATPVHWHAIMTIMAAESGKDVYCEKPTAITLAESRAAADAVKRYGRVFQAGTQQRSEYGGKFRTACEYVRSGRIGKLKEVWSSIAGGAHLWHRWDGPGKAVPAGWDWDLFLGPAPWSPYNGQWNAHLFATEPTNWGQHHFDIVQWGIGADDTGPVEIGPERVRYANGVEVICRRYPDATIGLGPGVKFAAEGGCVFVGTQGVIAVDRNQLLSNPAGILRELLGPNDVHLYDSGGHANNFIHCVRSRGRTICNEDVAHHAANLMLLPAVAASLGRNLKWDPVAERFDDDAANRLMSVAYRPPWKLG